MARIVIVHGTTSRPERSWFPWLTWQLLRKQHEVYCPRLPTPHHQSLKSWSEAFHAQTPRLDETTYLIGHSTGVPFLLKWLESSDVRVAGAAFVSGFFEMPPHPDFAAVLSTFVEPPFCWEKIQRAAGKFLLYHGDDDAVIPLRFGESLAHALGAPLTVIAGGKHLNSSAQCFELPQLLKDLENSWGL